MYNVLITINFSFKTVGLLVICIVDEMNSPLADKMCKKGRNEQTKHIFGRSLHEIRTRTAETYMATPPALSPAPRLLDQLGCIKYLSLAGSFPS